MGKAKDQAGNIWETDAQGNAVRLLQPAPSNPMNSPFVDPRLAPQVQKAQNEATASQYAPQTAQADATIKSADAANAGAIAAAERDRAVAEAQKSNVELQKLKLEQSQTDPKSPTYKALQAQIDHVAELYRQNLQGGLPNQLTGLIPNLLRPSNGAFDSAAQGLVNPYMRAFRVPGVGSQSDTELKQFVQGNVPSSSDSDVQIQEKLGNLQRQLDAANPQAPAPQSAPPIPTQQGATALTDGKTKPVVDPVLQATGRRLGAMISQGVPDDKILQFLRNSGVDPANTNIQSVLHTRSADPKFKEWQRQNPGKAYPIGPEFYTKQVPVSGGEAMLNAAALSPVGAFGASAANAMAGGYLDNMMQNPEQARTAMQLLRTQNPMSSFAGDVAGYVGDEALLGRIPGAQALMAGKWGRRGADAAYGAFSGSGENDGDRLTGALTGGLVNAGGGMFGRGVQRSAGAALTGVRNSSLSYLDKAGVPLTVGRIARGAGDISPLAPSTAGDELGKGVGGIEDRLMGLPGLDAVIGTARQRGDQAFNQAAMREIAPGVTGTGTDGLMSAKAAEAAAYKKMDPVQLSVDQPFSDSLSAAEQAAKGLSHHSSDVGTVISDIRQQISDGGMTGKGYQTAMQAIRKTRATLNDDVGGKAASLLDGLEQEVVGLGSRQGGQVAQDLAEANAIHSRRKVMQTALRGGPAQGAGEMVSPKGLNQASIGNTTRFGGLDKALSPQRPFYDLTSAGMKVMPNLTPDSGTAGRLLLYPLIAGAGGAGIGAMSGDNASTGAGDGASVGAGLGLLTLGAAAGPYSRTGQKIIQKALLGERPEALAKIGDLLRRNPRFAGMFGSSAARDYFMQPELPAQ